MPAVGRKTPFGHAGDLKAGAAGATFTAMVSRMGIRRGAPEESRMKKWIVTIALAGLSALAWALPTLQEVQAEVQQGRYARAEEMMREVVAAKPDSARAHYVNAEILARNGKVGLAAEEAKKARQIDPDIKFTDPEKFRSFEAALLRAQTSSARAPIDSGAQPAAPTRVAPAATTGVPSWVWLAGLAVVGVLLWRGFARSRAAQGGAVAAPGAAYGTPGSAYGPGPTAPMGAPPYGPGYQGYPPQRGSGMLGTGLAAAGGVAAGMLASEMLQRHRGTNADADAAGGQPGFFDSPQPSADLESRPVDFGSGGDWDAGSSDAGGGSDGGGWD